jgi:hypothetical protein
VRAALLALAGVAAIASCLVTRKSTELACETDGNCESDRTCVRGYCVAREVDANPCPAVCPACDFVGKICPIECDTPNSCRNIDCPAGYDCTINCTKANACFDIDCTEARSCTVNCTVTDGCEDVTCGPGPCKVTCTGPAACRDVACETSCRCDVACANGACAGTSCPMGPPLLCTVDGTPATSCSSTAQTGCSDCP